jgi:hypothetical protein
MVFHLLDGKIIFFCYPERGTMLSRNNINLSNYIAYISEVGMEFCIFFNIRA